MPSLPSSGASSRKGSASGLSSRKGSASGSADPYTSPALVPGYVDVPPSPSLLLLKKYVAGQRAKDEGLPRSLLDSNGICHLIQLSVQPKSPCRAQLVITKSVVALCVKCAPFSVKGERIVR